MQDVNIDRLCLAVRSLILHCMKKAMHQPTTEELYALEKRARRERAEYVAALFASLVSFIRHRAASALSSKVVRHA
jgi:hypothetical protein